MCKRESLIDSETAKESCVSCEPHNTRTFLSLAIGRSCGLLIRHCLDIGVAVAVRLHGGEFRHRGYCRLVFFKF